MTLNPFQSEKVRGKKSSVRGWVVFGVLCILVFAGYIFFQSAVIVDDEYLGHVYCGGELVNMFESGFHFINPICEEVKLHSRRPQSHNCRGAVCFSSDNQEVFLDVDVLFRFYPDCFDETLENKTEEQIVDKLIALKTPKFLRDVISDYKATEIPAKRDEIADRFSARLKKEICKLKTISIDEVYVININYSSDFYERIESAVMPKLLEEYKQKSSKGTP